MIINSKILNLLKKIDIKKVCLIIRNTKNEDLDLYALKDNSKF